MTRLASNARILLLALPFLLAGCPWDDNTDASGAAAFALGGTISGLNSAGLVLANGTDTFSPAASATTFSFAVSLSQGANYAVSVRTQPAGATCSVANGSGTAAAAAITNVQVSCLPNVYSIGGSISGLTSAGLVLANGSDSVSPDAGAQGFAFAQTMASGSAYAVSVKTQPANAVCSVSSGSGTVGAAAVTSVQVACATDAYKLGGTIAGLASGSLVLANGSDAVTVAAGAQSFAFANPVAEGGNYAVAVQTQPTGTTCSVGNGSGTMGGADVTTVQITCSASTHVLGGTIAGLGSAGLVLANGSDTMAPAGGAKVFAFPNAVAQGASYAVTVKTQPAGATCSVSNGSGTMGSADVSTVLVSCVANAYSVGGTITGLGANGLTLANGADTVRPAAGAAGFAFTTAVAQGGSYSVTVTAQPAGSVCTVLNGSGTIGAAPVTSVQVSCIPIVYSIGGTISGLASGGLVLANGADTVSPSNGATAFVFAGKVAQGGSYAVSVMTQPVGATCVVANGSGTVGAGNVGSVQVTCAGNSYSVGGSISGLTASGLVLANGNDTVSPAALATSFTLPAPVVQGGSYAVSVKTQPAGANCAVANGSGTVGAGNVGTVQVTCTAMAYTVSGSISGLTSNGLVLANGSDTVSPASGASIFTFPQLVASGATYAVTVRTQPPGATCSVVNASGTVGSAPVTTVAVTCAPNAFGLGGTIAGLNRNGLVLANGSDTVAPAAGALSFSFPTAVAQGSSYAVSVLTQPTGLNCSVAGGSGIMGAAAVNTVQVACGPAAYTVGGSITGLTGAGLVLANGSDTVQPAAGATSFVLPTPVVFGGTYSVTVQTQPAGQTCSVAGSFPATMGSGNVTTVAVSCTTTSTYALVAGQQTCPAQPIVDGTGAAASLNPQPTGTALDSAGNYYAFDGARVRKVTPGGVVTTLAGGAPGAGNGSQVDGTGSAAVFGGGNANAGLIGVAVDGSGNVFVVDWHMVRKVTPAGVVTTIAGSTTAGFLDGPGAAARFFNPHGIAFDPSGNLVVLDSGNFAIRRISPAGVVITLAQGLGFVGGAATNGTALQVSGNNGIVVDASANMFVATSSPNGIQSISVAGVPSNFAGSSQGFADGTGAAAKFYTTEDLSTDAAGNLYVVDSFYAIRKVTAAAVVTTPVVITNFSNYAPGGAAVPAGALVVTGSAGLYRTLATPSGNFYLVIGCSLQKTGP